MTLAFINPMIPFSSCDSNRPVSIVSHANVNGTRNSVCTSLSFMVRLNTSFACDGY